VYVVPDFQESLAMYLAIVDVPAVTAGIEIFNSSIVVLQRNERLQKLFDHLLLSVIMYPYDSMPEILMNKTKFHICNIDIMEYCSII